MKQSTCTNVDFVIKKKHQLLWIKVLIYKIGEDNYLQVENNQTFER